MSSVWSASMSNGGGDLACHMCLSAYELTGRDVETNWINTRRHWGGGTSLFRCPVYKTADVRKTCKTFKYLK